jgi:hypothetical protein
LYRRAVTRWAVQLPTLRAAISIRKPSRTKEEIMPINIRVDADVGGKKIEYVFNWEGTSEEIQNVLELIEGVAKLGNVSPRSFALGTLKHLPATGVMENEDECQVQMSAIVYTVLTCAEEELDLPAPIAELAEHQLINATVRVRDDGVSMNIYGSSEFTTVH